MPPHAHPRVIARGSAGERLVYEVGDAVRVTVPVGMNMVDAERAIMCVFDACTGGADVVHREPGSHDATLHRDRYGRFSSNTSQRFAIVDRVHVTRDAVTVESVSGATMQVAAWGADALPADADIDAAVRAAAVACVEYQPERARHTRYVGPFDGVAVKVRGQRPYGKSSFGFGRVGPRDMGSRSMDLGD